MRLPFGATSRRKRIVRIEGALKDPPVHARIGMQRVSNAPLLEQAGDRGFTPVARGGNCHQPAGLRRPLPSFVE